MPKTQYIVCHISMGETMRYCFYDFEGKIITQDDQCYEVARLEWNRAIDKYPLIIAYCACASDVQEAIRWSRKYQ